jgi:prolyl-tRNA synthetase
MDALRGVEVGNIFKLGTRYSEALGAEFLDQDGVSHPVIMGSYGIGSGRLLACIAEEHHDERGLIWPISVAPYAVHLVALKGASEVAEEVYAQLLANGIEVLFDDREESPGVKFADADLIGLPLRLTASKRSLERGGIEMKLRGDEEATVVSVEEIAAKVQKTIAALQEAISARVVEVPFEGDAA